MVMVSSSILTTTGRAAHRRALQVVGFVAFLVAAACHSQPAPSLHPGDPPVIAGCPILPANHIFNTAIDTLPVHPDSGAFLATIGSHHVHLDLGTTVDQASPAYYGIPYNVVHGGPWTAVQYHSAPTRGALVGSARRERLRVRRRS